MTELEKQAEAFAGEVEAEVGRCCGDNLNISALELAARLAPLLVEVCEQREKERAAVYAERDQLVSALSKVFPSHLARHPEEDAAWENDWRWVVCIHSPAGQLTWHIHDSERNWFNHLKVEAQHWDGHTAPEKYQRLAALTTSDGGAEAAELALQTQIENWQKRIYETCKKVYPEVDGGGCDSGDELDFTITEIEQVFAQLADYAVCSYCGKKTEKYRTKEQMVDVLAEHIPNCPGHPVNQAVAAFEENDKLKAALQAKEQELASCQANLLLAHDEMSDLINKLAQARQQAIAECARIVFDEGYEAVAHRLRSLTPPPALTPTCIGYEGGCDGNLTGEPHEANCPMFAPPALTKEK